MVTRACTPLTSEATLMLKDVMSKLMREYVAQHETPQRFGRPRHDTLLAEIRAGGFELSSLLLAPPGCKPPRRQRLVVQGNSPKPDELTEDEPSTSGRGWD